VTRSRQAVRSSAATAAEQFEQVAEQARRVVVEQRQQAASDNHDSDTSSISSIGELSAGPPAAAGPQEFTVHDCLLYQPLGQVSYRSQRAHSTAPTYSAMAEAAAAKTQLTGKKLYCGETGLSLQPV